MATAAHAPELAAALRRVRRTLDDAGASLTGRRVLLLCSGGADSVALVALLAQLPRGSAPASRSVLWLDHGLRDDVAAEEHAARAAAAHAGATFHLARAHEGELLAAAADGSGLEAAARAWRYAEAMRWAQRLDCDVVATGHTASDQLECALLALVGVTGRSGDVDAMPVARPLDDACTLVRPLLALTRDEVEAACRALALDWARDPSNDDPDAHVRNAMRHRVVPPLLDAHPGAGAAIVRAGERRHAEAAVAPALADALLHAWGSPPGTLDVRRLAALPTPARHALLARWLASEAGLGRALTARIIRAVDALAVLPARAACRRIDLAGGACVRRDGYHLVLASPSAPEHGGSRP